MKRVAMAAAISLATFMAAALLWRFRGAATLFVLSLVAAATVRPFVEALEPRLGRVVSLALVYVSGLALLGTLAYVVSQSVFGELDLAVERMGAAYDHLRTRPRGASSVHGFFLSRLPPAADLYRAVGGARPSTLLQEALGVTRNVIDLTGQFLILIALSAYWNASRESFERLWLSMAPASGRPRARDVWRAVERQVSAHLRSELAQSVLCVLVLAVMFRLGRLPTPVLPAIAAGILRLVPFFGIPFAAALSYFAAASAGPGIAALAAAITVVVIVAADRIVGRRLLAAPRPSPTLTVVFIVALVEAYGALGLLAASTLAVAVGTYLARLIATHPRSSHHARSLAQVEERLDRIRSRITLLPDPEATQLGTVVARLDALTTEARRISAP